MDRGTLITDPTYLRDEQYKTSANLMARAALHVRFRTNPQSYMHWIFDSLALRPNLRLLEVGGGPGYLWGENAGRLPEHLRLLYSDFSLGMVREARPALSGFAGVAFANLDVQHIPAPSGAFDVAIANHMLYHVADLPRAVGELARVLKPGGTLYAATNGEAHLHELDGLVAEFDPRLAGSPQALAVGFRLENAAEVLAPAFGRVEIRRYDNALSITEARPLADYIQSTWRWGGALAGASREFEAFIQSKLDAQGGIHITIDAGLSISQKR